MKDKNMKELIVDAKMENLNKIISLINIELQNLNCSAKIKMHIELAVEEIFSNIVNYAFEKNLSSDYKNIIFKLNISKDKLTLIFMDSGKPYNPLESITPDISESSTDRKIGGLGIFIVKNIMDEIHYIHQDNQNILTLTKNL